MRSPCAVTRVATATSKPARRAARAMGKRCDQKYQSSVTRKMSFFLGLASTLIGGGPGYECARQPQARKPPGLPDAEAQHGDDQRRCGPGQRHGARSAFDLRLEACAPQPPQD